MKVSRSWLQNYFDTPLPEAKELAEALTFHAFEIESVENDVLDVKVTANRGHDCLSHRAIAKELAAILDTPLKTDPLRAPVSLDPKTSSVAVLIEAEKCNRFTGAYIRGVEVGPSPEWLKKALEEIGQRSINNVVDATNYVMLDLGQPLHAFDAGKLQQKNGTYAITVRMAMSGEKMLALDDKEYTLSESMMVVADQHAGVPAGIAGVKGGKPSGVDEKTTDIILESANFDGVSVRKTSQALKLRTDASSRFEQVISPEMAAYGTRSGADLIIQLAGGELRGFVDVYPKRVSPWEVSVTLERINQVLGTIISAQEVADAFSRLDLPFTEDGATFTVAVPFERLDLQIPEDLVEEVGRVIGYDKVPEQELSPFPRATEINRNFYAAERIREALTAEGYSEVFTSVFAESGDQAVLNKVGGERPYLRTSLIPGLQDARERNTRNADLLGLKEVKLFEIGTVWKGDTEMVMVGKADAKSVTEGPLSGVDADAYENLPVSTLLRYKPFSRYPSITRDISLWVPAGTESSDVEKTVRGSAGELLQRIEFFDRFEKGEKLSLAFRLVFQSFDRTLTDEDANTRMESVYAAMKDKGWEVR